MTENYNAIRGLMTTVDGRYFIPYVDKVKCDGDGNEISETYAKRNSITNCILEAPNGVMELALDGINITLKQGLKVLIPNARNADGTLKNIEITLSADNGYNGLSASSANTTYYVFVDSVGGVHAVSTHQAGLSADKNKYISSGNFCLFYALDLNKTLLYSPTAKTWTEVLWAFVGTITKTSATTATLQAEEPIYLLKQTDNRLIADMASPSDRYISLSLGVSGDQYTATVSGYVFLEALCSTFSSAQNDWITVYSGAIADHAAAQYNNDYLRVCIPIKKGKTFNVTYKFTKTTIKRFELREVG